MKRPRLLLAIILVAITVLCVSLWVGEGPLWRMVMTKRVELFGADGSLQGMATVKRYAEPPRHEIPINGPVLRDAVPHGDVALWHSNGLIRLHGKYQHGKRNGIWTFWTEQGDVRCQLRYDDGEWIECRS